MASNLFMTINTNHVPLTFAAMVRGLLMRAWPSSRAEGLWSAMTRTIQDARNLPHTTKDSLSDFVYQAILVIARVASRCKVRKYGLLNRSTPAVLIHIFGPYVSHSRNQQSCGGSLIFKTTTRRFVLCMRSCYRTMIRSIATLRTRNSRTPMKSEQKRYCLSVFLRPNSVLNLLTP